MAFENKVDTSQNLLLSFQIIISLKTWNSVLCSRHTTTYKYLVQVLVLHWWSYQTKGDCSASRTYLSKDGVASDTMDDCSTSFIDLFINCCATRGYCMNTRLLSRQPPRYEATSFSFFIYTYIQNAHEN